MREENKEEHLNDARDDCRYRSSFYTHLKAKDEKRVEQDIGDDRAEGRVHRIFGFTNFTK